MDLHDVNDINVENIATKDQNYGVEIYYGDDGEIAETNKEKDVIQNAAQGILALSSQKC